jgi:threonine-phosphate decarboxylase
MNIEHGGNIYKVAQELGLPESRIIDFSASLNPLGISKKVKMRLQEELDNIHNYPDPDVTELRKRLSEYHGINLETILCGNGSTELIYLIPRVLKPRRVLIPSPTFLEYERAVNSLNLNRIEPKQTSTIVNLSLKEADNFRIDPDAFINAMQGCDMAFLCNPNNPTGRLLKKKLVLKIAEAAKELRCLLIVDEAFIDFCPGESVIRYVQDNPYLVVLRSMTKFYALSGLRVGYGVFPEHLIGKLKALKEPWTVNILAQKAAIEALQDSEYVERTMKLIKAEKSFLENSLKQLGIEFLPSDANFYLMRIDNAEEISMALKGRGMMVRRCSNFRLGDSYIRIAVKLHRENELLIEELARLCRV